MTLLTQDELNPLQEARRCAELHMETIRQIALARMPASRAPDEDSDRWHRIAEVYGALKTIYDNVSELEFEDEPEPEPIGPEETEQDDELELDDDEDEENDDDED